MPVFGELGKLEDLPDTPQDSVGLALASHWCGCAIVEDAQAREAREVRFHDRRKEAVRVPVPPYPASVLQPLSHCLRKSHGTAFSER